MIESILSKFLDFIVNKFWNNLTFWHIVGITLFVILILIISYRNKIIRFLLPHKRIAHDIKIFEESNQFLDENQFNFLIDKLGTDRVYTGQTLHAHRFIDYLNQVGNQYLDNGLRKKCSILVTSLDKLLVFISLNFFVYPEEQNCEMEQVQLALQPEILHIGSSHPAYKDTKILEEELYKMLDKIYLDYKNYRSLVLNKLYK